MSRMLRICLPWAILLCSPAFAYIGPLPGTENIPQLMAASTLVCKGEVADATPLTTSTEPNPPHLTATASVHVDRCFKGSMPPTGLLPVLFDSILPPGGGPYVSLQTGEYRLFFLKPEGDKYVIVDNWFGRLSISRLLSSATVADEDPMQLLELDLKAGLHDGDSERVLDSIRMLGNMRHLQSTAELLALLDSPDTLVRAYVYEALLRLRDYSVLPVIDQWLENQPEPPRELFLPRDALFDMQFRLIRQIALIRDPASVPVLVRLLHLRSAVMRGQVLQALRAIRSPQSAASLLQMLDDPDADNGYVAMQSLIELSGGGPITWVPSWPEFRRNPAYYAARCREWWQSEGQQKASHQIVLP